MTAMTMHGQIAGTVQYMAPEQDWLAAGIRRSSAFGRPVQEVRSVVLRGEIIEDHLCS
jgi:hypothetical protein